MNRTLTILLYGAVLFVILNVLIYAGGTNHTSLVELIQTSHYLGPLYIIKVIFVSAVTTGPVIWTLIYLINMLLFCTHEYLSNVYVRFVMYVATTILITKLLLDYVLLNHSDGHYANLADLYNSISLLYTSGLFTITESISVFITLIKEAIFDFGQLNEPTMIFIGILFTVLISYKLNENIKD